MLVLGREDGERISIGQNIVITLVESKRGKAKIGIDAPPEIPIVRDDAKCREKRLREFEGT